MNADRNKEVWKRLLRGGPLDGLGLPFVDGRVDLSGLAVPAPSIGRTFRTAIADVVELQGISELHRVQWKGLDFTGVQMDNVRFHDCTITDCVFDKARCQDWRLWNTTVTDCTFCSTDLRNSVLGAIKDSRRDVFRGVVFRKTDMRGTIYASAEFDHCIFENARLDKVNFNGSSFSHCSFEGELREVMFYRKAFRAEDLPPNEMDHIDFTRARLRSVEFRGLELKSVFFPDDEDHIILDNYPQTLDKLLGKLAGRTDRAARLLIALLSLKRKWAAPSQRRGILSRLDIIDAIGNEDAKRFLELISECQSETKPKSVN
jgi:uncharacterized protein YjbI with pentapeptide repeats